MSDSDLSEPVDLDQLSTAVEPDTEDDGDAGHYCSNCGQSKTDDGVCRYCGFYPLLGRCMELDPWDRAQPEGEAEPKKAPSHLEVWMNLIPLWGWVLIGCILAVILESTFIRLTGTRGARRAWSTTQLGIGVICALVLHIAIFVRAIMLTDQVGFLDFLTRPIWLWIPSIKRLPHTLPVIAPMASSLTAVLSSFLIIGALPYDSLWDWGIEPPPKKNKALTEAVARSNEDDKSLEEAVQDFAGDAVGEKEDEQDEPEPERIDVECVVIGYRRDRNDPDTFASLILASDVDGELKIVGTVSAGIPPKTREELQRRLLKLRQATPVVRTLLTAQWVEPRITCRVSCVRRTKGGSLIGARWEALLADLSLD